jgi:hypothetical protein
MAKVNELIGVLRCFWDVLSRQHLSTGPNGFHWLNCDTIPHFILHCSALHLRHCMLWNLHLGCFLKLISLSIKMWPILFGNVSSSLRCWKNSWLTEWRFKLILTELKIFSCGWASFIETSTICTKLSGKYTFLSLLTNILAIMSY